MRVIGSGRLWVIAAIFLASGCFGTSLSAQTTDTATRNELAGIRTSLEQLVVLVRELVQQSARRDRVTALTQRIDNATRRLAPREEELRALRERRHKEEAELTQLRGALDGLAEMAKQDVTGSASQAIESERTRLNTAIAQKSAAVGQVNNELSVLENDLASKRAAIDELERALDNELTRK